MAFTKKTKPAPKPASYARKSKKHEEVEEVEEVETEETEAEEQSDYEDAPEDSEERGTEHDEQPQKPPTRRDAGGYQSNNYAQPHRSSHRPSQGPRPSYGTQRNSSSQGDGKGVRVTGLFAGKREGLWTGRLRKEDIEKLMGLFDDALNTNQLVAMFLWENQDGPQFSLTANIAQEFKGQGQGQGGNRFNRGYRGSIGRR